MSTGSKYSSIGDQAVGIHLERSGTLIVRWIAAVPHQNVLGRQAFDSFLVAAFDGVEQVVRRGVDHAYLPGGLT
jgi:hypothetical protein